MRLLSLRRKERKIRRKMDYFQREAFRLSRIDRAKSSQMYAEADRLMEQLIVVVDIRQQGRS